MTDTAVTAIPSNPMKIQSEKEITTMVDLRKEYPRPQFVRESWVCLNGEWDFAYYSRDIDVPDKIERWDKIPVPSC